MGPEKSVYQRIYRDGLREGFCVDNARHYYKDGQGTQPRLEQTMETPYLFRGQNVIGFTDTDLRDSLAGPDGIRHTDDREFYIADQYGRATNLDKLLRPGEQLVNKNTGGFVAVSSAKDHMAHFAGAASEYPHVFMYEEYMESRSYLNPRFGMPKPTAQDYEEYLDNMSDQLRSRDIIFTGRITKSSELHIAYETSPIFQKEYKDWSSSVDAQRDDQFGG